MSYTFKALHDGEYYDIPDYQIMSFGCDQNDVGAITFKYARNGFNADIVRTAYTVIVPFWDGTEIVNGRFIVQAIDDSNDPADVYFSIRGRTLLDIYRKVVVRNPFSPGKSYRFTNATPGQIMVKLFQDAQARNAMQGITWDFSETLTSAGKAWNKRLTIEYKPGASYLNIIRNLCDQGLIDMTFEGTTFRVFNVDENSVDYSLDNNEQIVLRAGIDYEELPVRMSAEERRNYSLLLGNDEVWTEVTLLDEPIGPFGREEQAVSQGGMNDPGSMALVNAASLARTSRTKNEYTRKINIRTDGPVPGVDYLVGDWILDHTGEGKPERYRIVRMAIGVDDRGQVTTASVTFNDVIQEWQLRVARKVDGIIGGAATNPDTVDPPTKPKDLTIPLPPSGVIASGDSYQDGFGRVFSLGRAAWLPPIKNTDGTDITDLSGYETQMQVNGTITYSTPTAISPARIDNSLRAPFDRRGKSTARGWVAADNASSVRDSSSRDWFFWADTFWGTVDSSGKVANGWVMPHNTLTISTPTSFESYAGWDNLVVSEAQARCETTTGWTVTNCTIATNAWKHNGIGSLQITRAATGAMTAVSQTRDCAAGESWQAMLQIDLTSSATVREVQLQFLNSANAVLSTFTGTPGTYGRATVRGVSPANTTKVRVIASSSSGAAGQQLRFTKAGLTKTTHDLASWRSPNSNAVDWGYGLAETSLINASDCNGPTNEYLWAADSFSIGNIAHVFYHGIYRTGTTGNFSFENTDNVYLARFDMATKKFLDMQKWSTSGNAWGHAVRVDGAYVYIMGRQGTANDKNILSRVSSTALFGTREFWNGNTWVTTEANAAVVATTPMHFSALRKIGTQWKALYAPFYGTKLMAATAPAPQGPWTIGEEVFAYPEASGDTNGKTFKYLPRFHTQYDSVSNGLAFSYCQNASDATSFALRYVPVFLRGPLGTANMAKNGTWENNQRVDTPEQTYSGLMPNQSFAMRVRSVDSTGNTSTWVESAAILLPGDSTPPSQPSKPLVESFFQGVRVTWDGLNTNGVNIDNDVKHVEVHISEDESFIPTAQTKVDILTTQSGGVSPVMGLQWDHTYWCKLVAVDFSDNRSDPSEAASATPNRLSDPDLPNKLITGAKIAENSISVKNLTVASFEDSIIPNGGFEDADDTGAPYGWRTLYFQGNGASVRTVNRTTPIAGSGSYQQSVTTTDSCELISQNFSVTAGSIYYISVKVRASRAIAKGAVGIRLWTATTAALIGTLGDPNVSTATDLVPTAATVPDPLPANTVVTIEGSVTIPAGHRFGSLSIWPRVEGTTPYDIDFDDVEVRKIVGEAAIANASITNAKIRNLAVDDAKIANASVGKLTSGLLDADVAIGKRIYAPSLVGQRMQIDINGAHSYDNSDNIVSELRTDGWLISRKFATNTTGTRIEAGQYASSANAAQFSFWPSDENWMLPPSLGFSNVFKNVRPGIVLSSGIKTQANYDTYGLATISSDPVTGILLTTGRKIDANGNVTESTTGSNITLDPGGKGATVIRGGGTSQSLLHLSADPTKSELSLNGGILNMQGVSSRSNYALGLGTWTAGSAVTNMFIKAVNGLRVEMNGKIAAQFYVDGTRSNLRVSGVIECDDINNGAKIRTNNGTVCTFQPPSSGTVKTFVIQHPMEEDKYLVHAALEGPTADVHYRGQARNNELVQLPSYFKGLVKCGWTIQLTPEFTSDLALIDQPYAVASGRTEDSFVVHTNADVVNWLVVAERRNADFETEPSKTDYTLQGDGPYTYLQDHK